MDVSFSRLGGVVVIPEQIVDSGVVEDVTIQAVERYEQTLLVPANRSSVGIRQKSGGYITLRVSEIQNKIVADLLGVMKDRTVLVVDASVRDKNGNDINIRTWLFALSPQEVVDLEMVGGRPIRVADRNMLFAGLSQQSDVAAAAAMSHADSRGPHGPTRPSELGVLRNKPSPHFSSFSRAA